MITPILKTERILLRPPKTSDAEAVFENWASDSDVTRFMRWSEHQTIEVTMEWLVLEEGNISSGDSYSWVFEHKENGGIFGSGGLIRNAAEGLFELGYVIMKKYWNQGLTTEAAGEMLRFAALELGQTRIFATHAKENPASGRVLEKLGFVYAGDGEYSSFDGTRIFDSRKYFLDMDAKAYSGKG